MGYRYAILGAGRQGLYAAYDLARFGDAEEIRLFDLDSDVLDSGVERLTNLLNTARFQGNVLDVREKSQVEKALQHSHAAISAVPYPLNLQITEAAIAARTHLCDLGGHTDIVRQQLQLDGAAKKADITITPDCGLGPGLNISMGVYSMSFIEEPEEVLIWDGGLPQDPSPPWNYQLTFHINGLTNEYDGQAYFLRNGKVTPVPGMTETEILEFPRPLGTLEAAVTTGGLSTAPWTFEGKLKRLENKTLRYPGHWEWFRAFQQLGLFEEDPITVQGSPIVPREVYHALLEPKIAHDRIRDVVVIRVRCIGKTQGRRATCTLELTHWYDEKTEFTAMEQLTGGHIAMMAELAARGKIPRGAVPVELALPAETLAGEAAKRGWEIKNKTVVEP